MSIETATVNNFLIQIDLLKLIELGFVIFGIGLVTGIVVGIVLTKVR